METKKIKRIVLVTKEGYTQFAVKEEGIATITEDCKQVSESGERHTVYLCKNSQGITLVEISALCPTTIEYYY